MGAPLTPIERKVYQYLLDYLAEHTYQPSLREIGRRFRIGSTKTVSDILKKLELKGYIERGVAHSRGVRLVGYSAPGGTQPVPLYARAHAAPPALRAEDVVRHYAIDRRLLPGDDAFLVRAVGGDAVSHGVHDGDLVIVSPASRASDEDVLALRLGTWIHVRPVRRQGSSLIMMALTGETPLGRGDDFEVLGAVRGLVRAAEHTDLP